jgi:hypothetical protein
MSHNTCGNCKHHDDSRGVCMKRYRHEYYPCGKTMTVLEEVDPSDRACPQWRGKQEAELPWFLSSQF